MDMSLRMVQLTTTTLSELEDEDAIDYYAKEDAIVAFLKTLTDGYMMP